jgi:hypothetical protein
MKCELQTAGTIDLYFYGELPIADRAAVQAHISGCAECRQALEDLSVIRAALARRPDVATPPGGDWSGFMMRLNTAIAAEPGGERKGDAPARRGHLESARPRLVPYFAVAAAFTLVTIGVVALRHQTSPTKTTVENLTAPAPEPRPDVQPASLTSSPDPGLIAVSGQHFERSKLVVLGLATKTGQQDDWAFERGLATTLLSDTRLYRLAAEERGMRSLADTMGDLELVLLQASMSSEPTEASLQQLQRLIRRRDLLTKMDAY